jgi:plastocyanin
VTWVNHGAVQHSATSGTPGSPAGLWDSGLLSTGGSYTHVFTSAGTFHYYCSLHGAGGMTGRIFVH